MKPSIKVEIISPKMPWDAVSLRVVVNNLLTKVGYTLDDGKSITLVSGLRSSSLLARHYDLNFQPGMPRLYTRDFLKSPKSALFHKLNSIDLNARLIAVVTTPLGKQVFTYHSSYAGDEWRPCNISPKLLDKYYR